MQQGGNRKLQEFLAVYSLSDIIDIKVKYNTKAADYYRRRNNSLALAQPFEESPPEVHVGRTLLDGRRLDANGVPQDLTEEERANLSPQELAMGGNGNLTEEEVKSARGQAAGAAGAPASMNAFMDLMQSTVTSVYASAATTASNITAEDTAEKAKAGIVSGASYAKESVSAGAEVAMQKTSEAFEVTAEYTKYGLDQAAEKTKQGAGVVYEAGCDVSSAVK